ncbi:hypothetical protein Ade02nite_58580 [Paractinoplanes deccanensis]|uniref:Uncharacterized protein n=1 Tax=Paractinoplanes deccanensis TaxID=113561 RepID=A0ABQ3YB68_9ACTN|nr:hypothetical protein [Actinoplanes deccanensis]GID77217.1 hypothetical protein Ade02nite_58580 [Actinoplanes deccanensis]
MRILFDGGLPVAYGQAYVTSRELPDMDRAFAGQANGLCGAGDPGTLFLMTGTSDGQVHLTIELHEREPPPAAEGWEEVVEVSLQPRAARAGLVPWGDGALAELELPERSYRVRYCAAGMDEGRDPFGGFNPDEIEAGDYTYMDQRPDRYLLCFWPAPPTADAIVRQTSGAAAYWHGWAARLPAPPTLEQQIRAVEEDRRERQRRAEEYRLREEARRWGGRAPSDRLRLVKGNVFGLARVDRDLVDGVAEAGDAVQRRVAIWAARHAFAYAGIADLDWLAPAWAALENGEPLPAEFTDGMALLTRIEGAPLVTFSLATIRPLHQLHHGLDDDMLSGPVNRVAMALPALTAAAQPDPLQAALEALWAAVTAYGSDRGVFLAEVRRAFPVTDREGPL